SGVPSVPLLLERTGQLGWAVFTLQGGFLFAGQGYQSATVSTDAIAGNANLKFRLPSGMPQELGLIPGCVVSVSPAPLWRHEQQAQFSAFDQSEVAVVSCPAQEDLALLAINELNANVGSGCDAVELRVLAGGGMAGTVLKERVSAVFLFPDVEVSTGDIITVRFDSQDLNCNPGGATSEAAPSNGLWTVWSTDSGITATDNVLRIIDPLGDTQDAVFVTDGPSGTAASETESAAAQAVAAGAWTQPGGTVPPGGFVDNTFNAAAVPGLSDTSTTLPGTSIQRSSDSDTNTMTDWVTGTSSFGSLNSGQQ
ncbi:MAG: hypothetical protein ACI9WU_002852, partial [Myxococcota bacterium]